MYKGPVDDNFVKLGQGVKTGCCVYYSSRKSFAYSPQ